MAKPLFKQLEQSFRKLLLPDTSSLTASLRLWLYFPQVVSFAAIESYKNAINTLAAALAYTTILSIVPIVALAMLYTKIAGQLDHFGADIETWVLKSFVAESAQGIVDYVNQFIGNLHTKTLGTIGVGGLLFTAYSLLLSVEKNLNKLWQVKRLRSVWSRFQMLCSLLIVVPTFLSVSFYISGKVQMTSHLGSFSVIVPLLLTMASLFFMFKLVPNTYVDWKAAFFAAAISAILFEASKIAFNFYVVNLVSVEKIYGSLGLVPVFFIWIYLSWMIVLFGVELSFAAQNLGTLQEEISKKHQQNFYSSTLHEDRGLMIAQTLAKIFQTGHGPVAVSDISQETQLSAETVITHLDILIEEGLIAETLSESGQNQFVFCKPIDQIKSADILRIFRAKLKLPEKSLASTPLMDYA